MSKHFQDQDDSVSSMILALKPLVTSTVQQASRSKSGWSSSTHGSTFPGNTGQASSLTVTSGISPVCADFCVKWPIWGQTAGGKRSELPPWERGGAQHLTLWSRDHRKTSAPPPISSSPRWKVRRRAGLSEPQIAARHRPALKRENCKGPAISHRGEEQSRQRGVASDRAAAVQPSISHRLSLLTVTTTVATITTNTAWSLKGNSITNAKQ